MVCGYREPHFVVEKECELVVDGQRQRLQLRGEVVNLSWDNLMNNLPPGLRANTTPRKLTRYISIEAFDDRGQVEFDTLLLYSSGGADRLMADWTRIITDPYVDIDDLTGWAEKIVDHATGHSRDGRVSMY